MCRSFYVSCSQRSFSRPLVQTSHLQITLVVALWGSVVRVRPPGSETGGEGRTTRTSLVVVVEGERDPITKRGHGGWGPSMFSVRQDRGVRGTQDPEGQDSPIPTDPGLPGGVPVGRRGTQGTGGVTPLQTQEQGDGPRLTPTVGVPAPRPDTPLPPSLGTFLRTTSLSCRTRGPSVIPCHTASGIPTTPGTGPRRGPSTTVGPDPCRQSQLCPPYHTRPTGVPDVTFSRPSPLRSRCPETVCVPPGRGVRGTDPLGSPPRTPGPVSSTGLGSASVPSGPGVFRVNTTDPPAPSRAVVPIRLCNCRDSLYRDDPRSRGSSSRTRRLRHRRSRNGSRHDPRLRPRHDLGSGTLS